MDKGSLTSSQYFLYLGHPVSVGGDSPIKYFDEGQPRRSRPPPNRLDPLQEQQQRRGGGGGGGGGPTEEEGYFSNERFSGDRGKGGDQHQWIVHTFKLNFMNRGITIYTIRSPSRLGRRQEKRQPQGQRQGCVDARPQRIPHPGSHYSRHDPGREKEGGRVVGVVGKQAGLRQAELNEQGVSNREGGIRRGE
jgi:hypothetical protein